VQRLVVAVVADPDLGLEEALRPIYIGTVYGLSNLALVAVGRRGIDVPVPRVERGSNGVSGLIGGRLKDPEPDYGYLDAIGESELGNLLVISRVSPSCV
jgi:hypothetical protein